MNVFILTVFVCFALTDTVAKGFPQHNQVHYNHQDKDIDQNIIEKHQLQLKSNSVTTKTTRHFLGIILIPYIICFFASTGFWPSYPPSMEAGINAMGQQIFSQDDNQIRNFCQGKFRFPSKSFYRPVYFKGILYPYPQQSNTTNGNTMTLTPATTTTTTTTTTKSSTVESTSVSTTLTLAPLTNSAAPTKKPTANNMMNTTSAIVNNATTSAFSTTTQSPGITSGTTPAITTVSTLSTSPAISSTATSTFTTSSATSAQTRQTNTISILTTKAAVTSVSAQRTTQMNSTTTAANDVETFNPDEITTKVEVDDKVDTITEAPNQSNGQASIRLKLYSNTQNASKSVFNVDVQSVPSEVPGSKYNRVIPVLMPGTDIENKYNTNATNSPNGIRIEIQNIFSFDGIFSYDKNNSQSTRRKH